MRYFLGTVQVVLLLAAFSTAAVASPLPVANPSFETLPAGGLPWHCGGTCAYSIDVIPGWTDYGTTGQFFPGGYAGNPPAIDGSYLAWSDGGWISQDVGSAVAGATYMLQVDLLHRTDVSMAGVIQLEVGGGVVATATGPDLGPGTWSNWTAIYTATASDAGKTLTILLTSNDHQGDFDNVRMDSVPEPASMALIGIGLLGLAAVRRRLIR